MKVKYTGPEDVREVWGVTFARGQAVEVDGALEYKVMALADFEEVKRGKSVAQNID